MKSSVFVLGVLESPTKSLDTDGTGVCGNDVSSDWEADTPECGYVMAILRRTCSGFHASLFEAPSESLAFISELIAEDSRQV